jgi:hypothetical protein
MKISKKVVIFPQQFKSVTLEVSDVDSFEDADEILAKELSRYVELLEDEDIKILQNILGEKIKII